MGSLLAGGFAALVLKRLLQIDFHPALLTHTLAVATAALVATVAGWGASFRILGQETAGNSARRIGGGLWYDSSNGVFMKLSRPLARYRCIYRSYLRLRARRGQKCKPQNSGNDGAGLGGAHQSHPGKTGELRHAQYDVECGRPGARRRRGAHLDPQRDEKLQPEAASAVREVPGEEAGAAHFQGRRSVQRGCLPAGEEDAGDGGGGERALRFAESGHASGGRGGGAGHGCGAAVPVRALPATPRPI